MDVFVHGELVVLRRKLNALRNGVHQAIDDVERARDEAFGESLQVAHRRDMRRVRDHIVSEHPTTAPVHDSLADVFDSDRAVARESRVDDTAYTGPRSTVPRDRTRRSDNFGWI